MFTEYAHNSAKAMARVVAMAMFCDADVDSAEIEALEKYHVYQQLSLSAEDFMEVIHDYCQDLMASTMSNSIRLMETRRVNEVLSYIDDPQKQLKVCQLLLVVGEADGGFSDAELALFRHIMEYWGLTLEGLKKSVSAKPKA